MLLQLRDPSGDRSMVAGFTVRRFSARASDRTSGKSRRRTNGSLNIDGYLRYLGRGAAPGKLYGPSTRYKG